MIRSYKSKWAHVVFDDGTDIFMPEITAPGQPLHDKDWKVTDKRKKDELGHPVRGFAIVHVDVDDFEHKEITKRYESV